MPSPVFVLSPGLAAPPGMKPMPQMGPRMEHGHRSVVIHSHFEIPFCRVILSFQPVLHDWFNNGRGTFAVLFMGWCA